MIISQSQAGKAPTVTENSLQSTLIYPLSTRSQFPTTPLMARLVTQGPGVGLLRGKSFTLEGVWGFVGSRIPPPVRPSSSCFGGRERDGLGCRLLTLSMLLLLWLTLVTVETLCGAHVRVVLSLDMGGFLGVPHRRDAALGQLGSVPLSYVSHPIGCNLTACIFLPAGTSLACGLCSRRGSVHIVGRLLPRRGYLVGALFVM